MLYCWEQEPTWTELYTVSFLWQRPIPQMLHTPLTTTLALLSVWSYLFYAARVSYWVPIKLTHVPIPAARQLHAEKIILQAVRPILFCFYPTNFHQLEPPIHIYHEPLKIYYVEYNTKKQSVLKLTSWMDLSAFYNDVTYLTPVMKHNITDRVSYGEGGGVVSTLTLLLCGSGLHSMLICI